MPKVLKDSASTGGKGKKKKWSKSKSKDKLNNVVFWSKPVYDKLIRDVIAKEVYVTPSIISEKLKVNV
jgi:small subunit ribosomal protein S25e